MNQHLSSLNSPSLAAQEWEYWDDTAAEWEGTAAGKANLQAQVVAEQHPRACAFLVQFHVACSRNSS